MSQSKMAVYQDFVAVYKDWPVSFFLWEIISLHTSCMVVIVIVMWSKCMQVDPVGPSCTSINQLVYTIAEGRRLQ